MENVLHSRNLLLDHMIQIREHCYLEAASGVDLWTRAPGEGVKVEDLGRVAEATGDDNVPAGAAASWVGSLAGHVAELGETWHVIHY